MDLYSKTPTVPYGIPPERRYTTRRMADRVMAAQCKEKAKLLLAHSDQMHKAVIDWTEVERIEKALDEYTRVIHSLAEFLGKGEPHEEIAYWTELLRRQVV